MKRRKLLWLLAPVLMLGLANCTTTTGDGPTSTSQSASPEPEEGGVGNWKVLGKVKPQPDGLGSYKARFRVRNTSDAADTPLMTVNAMKGDEILGSLDCSGPEIGPGEIGTVKCFSTDKYRKGWTEVTVEDTF